MTFTVEKLTKTVGDKTVFKKIFPIIHDLIGLALIGVNGTGKRLFECPVWKNLDLTGMSILFC